MRFSSLPPLVLGEEGKRRKRNRKGKYIWEY